MERNSNPGRFVTLLNKSGSWIADFFWLQFLFVLYTLKGFVILGFFPSIMAMLSVFFRWFHNLEEHFSIREVFRYHWSNNYKVSNYIGYSVLFSIGFILMDLRINKLYLQSVFLHAVLLFLLAIITMTALYSFSLTIRAEYSYLTTIKQSFFVSLSVPTFSIAAIIGVIIVYEFLRNFPFFAFFFGMPLLLLPIAWFTYTGINKVIEKKEEFAK